MKIISLLCVVAPTAVASKDAYLYSSPRSLILDIRGGGDEPLANPQLDVPNLQKGPLAGLREKVPNAEASPKKEQQLAGRTAKKKTTTRG
jgi:hypothetical protein